MKNKRKKTIPIMMVIIICVVFFRCDFEENETTSDDILLSPKTTIQPTATPKPYLGKEENLQNFYKDLTYDMKYLDIAKLANQYELHYFFKRAEVEGDEIDNFAYLQISYKDYYNTSYFADRKYRFRNDSVYIELYRHKITQDYSPTKIYYDLYNFSTDYSIQKTESGEYQYGNMQKKDFKTFEDAYMDIKGKEPQCALEDDKKE